MGGKKAWTRAARLAVVAGSCWYRGQLLTRPMVAHAAQCNRPHHRRAAELTPPPARPRRAQDSSHPHLMKVWGYSAEPL
eukprot:8230027-Pyramimonas_sp.AAC.1